MDSKLGARRATGQAIKYAKSRDASIIQLTTNIKRPRAKIFYECLGFESTHVGIKLYLGDNK